MALCYPYMLPYVPLRTPMYAPIRTDFQIENLTRRYVFMQPKKQVSKKQEEDVYFIEEKHLENICGYYSLRTGMPVTIYKSYHFVRSLQYTSEEKC